MKRPVGVTIVAVLAIIGGSMQLLSSLGYLGLSALRTPILLGAVTGIAPAMMFWIGVLSLSIGVLAIASGIGALSLKKWAWLTSLVVWGTGLILSVIQMGVTGFGVVSVASGIIALAILIYLMTVPVFSAFGIETAEQRSTHHPSAV